MKLRWATFLLLLLTLPAVASEETRSIGDEMVANGVSKDIVFSLTNAYEVYLMAEFCQRTGSTTGDDLKRVAEVAQTYEASINLPELQNKLWDAASRSVQELSIIALDTNQSYGMCLDVKDSVDKVVLELKEPAPKPF